MENIKSFIIGFLAAIVILMSLSFTELPLGSVSWKPMYVKIVD